MLCPPVPTGLQVAKVLSNRLWIVFFLFCFFLCFLLQLVSHICKVSAPVPEMNRNLVLSKLTAENQLTCHSAGLFHPFLLETFLCSPYYRASVWLWVFTSTGRGRIFEEEDNDGVPVQLESIMVEWSTTCWLKRPSYSTLCLKKGSMHHTLFFFYLCSVTLNTCSKLFQFIVSF